MNEDKYEDLEYRVEQLEEELGDLKKYIDAKLENLNYDMMGKDV